MDRGECINMENKKRKKEISLPIQEGLDFKIDVATQTLDRNISLVSNCDNKASIVLTVFGVLFTIIMTSDGLKKIFSIVNHCISEKSFWSITYLVSFAGAILVMACGIFFLGKVLVARITKHPIEEEYTSLIFFSGINKACDFKTYLHDYCMMSKEALLDDLLKQIYINADIACSKYTNYNCGLKYAIIGFVFFSVVLIIGINSF